MRVEGGGVSMFTKASFGTWHKCIGPSLPLYEMLVSSSIIGTYKSNSTIPAKQRRNCDVIQPYQCSVV